MKLSVLILLDMDMGYDEIEAILGIWHGSFRLAKSSSAVLAYIDQVQVALGLKKTLALRGIPRHQNLMQSRTQSQGH